MTEQQINTTAAPTTEKVGEVLDAAARSHGNPAVTVDKGSELIDSDPVVITGAQAEVEKPKGKRIAFTHAGGSVGGQNINVCGGLDGCSALVQDEHLASHEHWHNIGMI